MYNKGMAPDLPIVSFASSEEWRNWLDHNYDKTDGVWLRFYKKASGLATISYDEAVDQALCYGWIDSQVKKYDENSYLQKFTPRRTKSIWSQINTKRIERLIKEGLMMAPGIKMVEEAKKDGRWQSAYNPPSTAEVPTDFLLLLDKNKIAKAFFKTLNKTNVYAIVWRLQTAKKPETREKRMNAIVAMLAEKKKFY